MEYMISIYTNDSIDEKLTDDDIELLLVDHRKLQDQYEKSGNLLATAKLMPMKTGVSVKDGLVDDTDGPYAESKEQFVGFYLLNCASIEEAIEAAQVLPKSHHRYEIRQVDWLGGHVTNS